MNQNWIFFFVFTLLCVFAQGFFSMFEMASVSFNRIRLQYHVGQKSKRGIWLNALLNKPSRLFGTTLIGINTFLQIGSEFSRRFYESLNLNPDLAPITQIFLVLILGELAPMFAARRHPEHVAMLFIPIVYVISKVLTPLIWLIDGMNHILQRLFRKKTEISLFLSREEIQKAFEEKEEVGFEKKPFYIIIQNFFTLKNKTAQEIMVPLKSCQVVSSQCTLREMRHVLSVHYNPFIPIYHRSRQNIVAVAYPRNLLNVDEDKRVLDFSTPPWFITKEDSVIEILKQFRRNNQSVAIVLDASGQAVGILTLDHLTDEIFGESDDVFYLEEKEPSMTHFERTLSGDMLIIDFNEEFGADLKLEGAETISDFINQTLKHHPVKDEKILIDNFEFIVIEPSLFGAKTVSVKTIS